MEVNANLKMPRSKKDILTRVAAGALLAASTVFSTGSGQAMNFTLKATDSSGIVIIWKNAEAMKEGLAKAAGGSLMDIIDSLMPLVSCLEVDGGKVSMKEKGTDMHNVHVTEGENHGCEGVITGAELG